MRTVPSLEKLTSKYLKFLDIRSQRFMKNKLQQTILLKMYKKTEPKKSEKDNFLHLRFESLHFLFNNK
jgi:hypothetical protein